MKDLISDNPRQTMLWAAVLFALSAIGGQVPSALVALVFFIWGAIAWVDYDLHVAKRDYEMDRFGRYLNSPEVEERCRKIQANLDRRREEFRKEQELYAARTNAPERQALD